MKRFGPLTVSFLAVLAVAGCAPPSAPPSATPAGLQQRPVPSGTWAGAGWGTVTLEGLRGSYTGSYGTATTTIELTRIGGRSFDGTWREGTFRSGWLKLTLSEDGKTLSGTWGADERCEHQPGNPRSAGFLWKRVR